MPYAGISDLPASVTSHLPTHAQEICLATFNNAWKEYACRDDREIVAHEVAWAAVKKHYEKFGKEWIKKLSNTGPLSLSGAREETIIYL